MFVCLIERERERDRESERERERGIYYRVWLEVYRKQE